MNERINLLAIEANKYSLLEVDRSSEFFHDIAMEKFAELLIRECIYAVEDASHRIDRYHYSEAIRKHLGIEE